MLTAESANNTLKWPISFSQEEANCLGSMPPKTISIKRSVYSGTFLELERMVGCRLKTTIEPLQKIKG